MIKVFSVDTDFINSRFDKWFKKKVCNVPQSFIEKNPFFWGLSSKIVVEAFNSENVKVCESEFTAMITDKN